jgi:hypothetical protein
LVPDSGTVAVVISCRWNFRTLCHQSDTQPVNPAPSDVPDPSTQTWHRPRS